MKFTSTPPSAYSSLSVILSPKVALAGLMSSNVKSEAISPATAGDANREASSNLWTIFMEFPNRPRSQVWRSCYPRRAGGAIYGATVRLTPKSWRRYRQAPFWPSQT